MKTYIQISMHLIIFVSLLWCGSCSSSSGGSASLHHSGPFFRDDSKGIASTDIDKFAKYLWTNDTVRIVNELRHLGKERAIAVLDHYVEARPGDFDNRVAVTLICRLLFVPPKGGWGTFTFGTRPAYINRDTEPDLAHFPFELYRGVPILLVEGFDLFGSTDEPKASLRRVRDLKLIPVDLEVTGFSEAAKEAISSDPFAKLYPKQSTRDQVAKVILARAVAN